VSAQTVDQVVARLQEIEQSLPPSDGVLWFNRLYLDVTLALRQFITTRKLAAPPFLQELTIFFGNRYFDAYNAAAGNQPVSKPWAPLFAARHDPRIAPLQFAIAGMNSHVSHDLEIGVVTICEDLGVVPAPDCPQRQDYDAPSEILGQAEAQTKQWLLTGAIKELDHVVAPVDDAVAIWSINRARDAAWVRAEVLWHIRDQQLLMEAYQATLEATVAMECRALLLPHGL
jgi:Family of unknown function (DUF5995)